MSGGSLQYIFLRVDDVKIPPDNQERIQFQQLLKLVAKALHDIEWVDSGDYGPGDELEAINSCFDFCKTLLK